MSQRNAYSTPRIAACSAIAAAVAIEACTFQVPSKAALPEGSVLLHLTPAGDFCPNDGREAEPAGLF